MKNTILTLTFVAALSATGNAQTVYDNFESTWPNGSSGYINGLADISGSGNEWSVFASAGNHAILEDQPTIG